jgi:hypothetical protein
MVDGSWLMGRGFGGREDGEMWGGSQGETTDYRLQTTATRRRSWGVAARSAPPTLRKDRESRRVAPLPQGEHRKGDE